MGFVHADEHASLHALDQCLQGEGREPRARAALNYVHYTFVRIHKTLRGTPAMEASVATRLRTVRDIADLLERDEPRWRAA